MKVRNLRTTATNSAEKLKQQPALDEIVAAPHHSLKIEVVFVQS